MQNLVICNNNNTNDYYYYIFINRGLFHFVDMTKDFYFSYTYDLTHSLQYNYNASKNITNNNIMPISQEMFEWNHYQIEGSSLL